MIHTLNEQYHQMWNHLLKLWSDHSKLLPPKVLRVRPIEEYTTLLLRYLYTLQPEYSYSLRVHYPMWNVQYQSIRAANVTFPDDPHSTCISYVNNEVAGRYFQVGTVTDFTSYQYATSVEGILPALDRYREARKVLKQCGECYYGSHKYCGLGRELLPQCKDYMGRHTYE